MKGEAMKRSEAGLKGERETISISLVISKEHFMFLEGQSVIEGASRSALIRRGIDLLIANPPPFGVSVVSDPEVIVEQLGRSAEAGLRAEQMIASDKKLLRPARAELRSVSYGKVEREGKTDGR